MLDTTEPALAESTEQARQQSLTERQVLEELVVDNADLEKLESLVDQFNLFEAIGMVQQEIRHSFFLKFLLDPNESHGMGDVFLKRLLQKVLSAARETPLPISLIDLDVWDMDETTVLREWNNIDILVLNTSNELAVIIENKIYSDEHSDQLKRYWDTVRHNYPGWRVLGLFLTRDGSLPSDERYLPVSYVTVADLIDTLAKSRASSLGGEVLTVLGHYTQMLRRYIVSGSEIDQLCLRLYQRHQRALDLIFERRPDRQKMIQEEIGAMVKGTSGFEVDKSTKTNILFVPKAWNVSTLLTGTQWSSQKRIMMFYFENRPEGVRLILQIGPGDAATRQNLFQMATTNKPLFSPGKAVAPLWSRIYNKEVVNRKTLEEADITDINDQIHKYWANFRNTDLPRIEQIMKDKGFIQTITA